MAILSWQWFHFEKFFLGAVKLGKNADLDKYSYS